MVNKPKAIRDSQNCTAAQIGSWEKLDQYIFKLPDSQIKVNGKLFLKQELKLTGMEVSLNKMPARAEMPFRHRHRKNEELYIFIKGTGQFQVDDEIIDICEGTVIRVAPEGIRTWCNNSLEDLYYIVIQAVEGSLTAKEISDGVSVNQPVEQDF